MNKDEMLDLINFIYNDIDMIKDTFVNAETLSDKIKVLDLICNLQMRMLKEKHKLAAGDI